MKKLIQLSLFLMLLGAGILCAQNKPHFPLKSTMVCCTYRNSFSKDVTTTIDNIKSPGITEMEFSNLFRRTAVDIRTMLDERGMNKEKIFFKHADQCLVLIEQAAQKISIKGVAIIAFIPGDVTQSWVSKMKVVGHLTNGKSNLLGIAYTKASEMADTHRDSGSGVREILSGELGYKGGLIKKVNSGYLLAVFSGGKSEQDLELAKIGLDYLLKFY